MLWAFRFLSVTQLGLRVSAKNLLLLGVVLCIGRLGEYGGVVGEWMTFFVALRLRRSAHFLSSVLEWVFIPSEPSLKRMVLMIDFMLKGLLEGLLL